MFLKNYFGREETKSVTKELVGSILEEEITEIDLDHWITEWELRGKDYTNNIGLKQICHKYIENKILKREHKNDIV